MMNFKVENEFQGRLKIKVEIKNFMVETLNFKVDILNFKKSSKILISR
jgi:hypothetical protein